MAKVPWSPDSWVKVILIVSLAGALTFITVAMAIRAIMSDVQIESESIITIFDQFIGLFGVVVGYVLGSRRNND